MPQPPEWLRKIQKAVDDFLLPKEEADKIAKDTIAKMRAEEARKAAIEATMKPGYKPPATPPPITPENFDENAALAEYLARRNQAFARGQQRALQEKK